MRLVPGIGTVSSNWASSLASATWPGMACVSWATASTCSTIRMFACWLSPSNRGFPRRKSLSSSWSSDLIAPVGLSPTPPPRGRRRRSCPRRSTATTHRLSPRPAYRDPSCADRTDRCSRQQVAEGSPPPRAAHSLSCRRDPCCSRPVQDRTELGRYDDLVTPAGAGLREQFLVGVRPVDPCRIEEGHSELDATMNSADRTRRRRVLHRCRTHSCPSDRARFDRSPDLWRRVLPAPW